MLLTDGCWCMLLWRVDYGKWDDEVGQEITIVHVSFAFQWFLMSFTLLHNCNRSQVTHHFRQNLIFFLLMLHIRVKLASDGVSHNHICMKYIHTYAGSSEDDDDDDDDLLLLWERASYGSILSCFCCLTVWLCMFSDHQLEEIMTLQQGGEHDEKLIRQRREEHILMEQQMEYDEHHHQVLHAHHHDDPTVGAADENAAINLDDEDSSSQAYTHNHLAVIFCYCYVALFYVY